ncbi:hypothetical protein [Caballeronia arationis]|uniref:hypothetical protein n=1 Tax=Caballeronia arationis TaxID=1777142 RepID=UPI000AC3B2FA|nr:hypothetical protein [Caballeronia arationis]
MNRTTYPAQIQAAEAKVAAQSGQNSYGGVADTASASGGPAHTGIALLLSISVTNQSIEPRSTR